MSDEKPTGCGGSGNPVPLEKIWLDGLGRLLVCCPACRSAVPVMLDGTPARVLDHRAAAKDTAAPCPECGSRLMRVGAPCQCCADRALGRAIGETYDPNSAWQRRRGTP